MEPINQITVYLRKQDNFVDEAKYFYTDLINTLVKDDKEKLHVFEENGLYFAAKKIGKNNPKAEQMQTDNDQKKPEKEMPNKPKIPPKPVMSAEVAAYPKLFKIYKELKLNRKNEEIDLLKIGLSGIVRRYGYQNVQEFYHVHHQSHSAYIAYKEQKAEWDKKYGEIIKRRIRKVCMND